MSNTLRLVLRSFHLPLKGDILKSSPLISSQTTRFLYAKSTLGIDAYIEQRKSTKNQMADIEDRFREKMTTYSGENSTNMIFTEDLKNMLHLAETDDDLDLAIKMAKKFNGQNKELRFGNFVFGPVFMRLFHVHNKPELALACFKSPELNGLFDQLITYQILLDLLYENGKYQEMLEVFEIIKNKQIQHAKYPRNAVVLVLAACYKLDSKESIKYALDLWKELAESGHFPMRRATTFCAGLALNQGQPDTALEILSAVKNPHYVTVRNLKVRALSQIGRLDEAIALLKSVISQDRPGEVTHTFSKDVVEYTKEAVLKSGNADISLEFNKLEKLLEKEGHISDQTLDGLLCSEIQQPPVMNNRQVNKFSRYTPQDQKRSPHDRFSRRPGLTDIA